MTAIRPGGPGDVTAVMALEAEAFGVDAWSRESVVAALPDLLVGGGGYVVLTVAGDVADLQRIAVPTGVRRAGAGRALLAAAVERADAAGAERVLVEVSEANAAGRAFYAANGFSEIHRRRRYYRDGTDALVLTRLARTPTAP
ncbi:N-acetyltransferase [Marmoricola endophyticus]|uniref:N-acetyltransferase n=1 Tax=Marmoricola endophyticus TaxID=2040280 RepID=A0A917BJU7_9ACTN|nr:GNAT family N-acetyltransferase [Marmoricola endophyticus]GGF42387.1 N-acetyltransferase [Marmoricola endophyticus]